LLEQTDVVKIEVSRSLCFPSIRQKW